MGNRDTLRFPRRRVLLGELTGIPTGQPVPTVVSAKETAFIIMASPTFQELVTARGEHGERESVSSAI